MDSDVMITKTTLVNNGTNGYCNLFLSLSWQDRPLTKSPFTRQSGYLIWYSRTGAADEVSGIQQLASCKACMYHLSAWQSARGVSLAFPSFPQAEQMATRYGESSSKPASHCTASHQLHLPAWDQQSSAPMEAVDFG